MGACAIWKAMLWKSIGCDISFDTFSEKAEICSCMYTRNVSLDTSRLFNCVVGNAMKMRCHCSAGAKAVTAYVIAVEAVSFKPQFGD